MTFVKRYPRALVRANPTGKGQQVVVLFNEADRNSSSQYLDPSPGRAQDLAYHMATLQRRLGEPVEDDHVFDSDSSQDEECIECGKTREEHR